MEFLDAYIRRTEDHGTCLCFEPLGAKDSDFINSAYDALDLVHQINHPAFRIQLDAKALLANDEVRARVFDDCADDLVHFHANQSDLGVLSDDGDIDHAFMGEQLRRIGYRGFVSIEQRMVSAKDPLTDVAHSHQVLRTHYLLDQGAQKVNT